MFQLPLFLMLKCLCHVWATGKNVSHTAGFGVCGPVPALFNIAHNPKAENVYPFPSLNVCSLLDAVSEIGDGEGINFFFLANWKLLLFLDSMRGYCGHD